MAAAAQQAALSGMRKSASSGSLAALAQHHPATPASVVPHHPAVSRLRPQSNCIPRAVSHGHALHALGGDHGHHPTSFAAPRHSGGAAPTVPRGLPPLPALARQHQDGGNRVRFTTSSAAGGRDDLLAAAAREQATTQQQQQEEQLLHKASGASHAAAASSSSNANVQGVAHKQQQQQQAAAGGGAPFASLTRVFLIGQPSNLMRQLAGRKWRVAGPVSLLLFLFGLLLAILTAVRTVLVRRVKACQCCKGYGIVRCRLCNGEGTVAWMGKNNHQEMCPLCMTKRFVTCPDCGGFHHRKMFTHLPATNGKPLVPEFLGSA